MVRFSRKTFVILKLKVFKVLRTNSASMKWPFLGGFGPLLSQIWFTVAQIFVRGSNIANQNIA